MMEEEREQQRRALDQIDDHFEETRPWYVGIPQNFIDLLWQPQMLRAYQRSLLS